MSEEAHRVLFGIQMQAGHQNEFLCLFLLEDGITVALPRSRQILRAVVVQKLLQDFLPAKLTHDVFIEL